MRFNELSSKSLSPNSLTSQKVDNGSMRCSNAAEKANRQAFLTGHLLAETLRQLVTWENRL